MIAVGTAGLIGIPAVLATLHAADSQFRWWWPTNWMAVPSVIFCVGFLLVAVPVRRSPDKGAVSTASLAPSAVPSPGNNRAGVEVRPTQAARPRQAILADALSAAQLISDEHWKAVALARVARAVAADDPGRAARLTTDAVRVAQSVSDEGSKALALVLIAGSVAAIDPGHAEDIARSITDEHPDGPFATLIAVIATYGGGYCGRCVCERSGMSRRDSIRSILARGSALVRSLCSLRRPASPGSCGAGFM